jgi:hypothetical protein
MHFVTRFRNRKSEEDVSYYLAELGTPTIFPQATERLYFIVNRLQLTRVGPTMRGEILPEDQAKKQINDLGKAPGWEEVKTPFK